MNAKEYKEAAAKYVALIPASGGSAQTTRGYCGILNQYGAFLEQNGVEKADDADAIGAWQTSLFENGASTNTIRHYLTVMRTFFAWCVERNYCLRCPIGKDMLPKKQNIKYDLLSLDEIKKLLSAHPNCQKEATFPRNRAIVLLIVGTGLRNSELRDLRLSDIDWTNAIITVRNGKGGKFRKVSLPSFCRDALMDYLRSGIRPYGLSESDWIFGSTADESGLNGGAEWHMITSAGICQMIKRYVYQATGHEMIGTHDLRHAFASLSSYLGASTRDISLVLGHASEAITQKVYIDILDKEKAADNINAAMNRLAI